jgi:hypothetical protein
MIYKAYGLIFFLFFVLTRNCESQSFDSVHVYAVSMNSSYYVKMDKDLIKNEVEPIVLSDGKKINSVHEMLTNTVKRGIVKKLKNNQLDIRLSLEFFENGKIVQTIGVTPYNTMFINYTLYTYDKQKLKYLDEYIEGLSKILGIK